MSGFADQFSDSQRAALAALGYTVLERHPSPAPPPPVGAAVGRDRPAHATHPEAEPAPRSRPTAAPTGSTDRDAGSRPTAAPAGSSARKSQTEAAAAALPGRIVIDGMDGSALARGILQAATAAGDGGKVHHDGEQLTITLRTGGDLWQISLHQLRRSPRHKAALWRALRTLRRCAP